LSISNIRQVRFFKKYFMKVPHTKIQLLLTKENIDLLIPVNMNKVVVKILQGSVVTQTLLDGLTVYTPVDNSLQCMWQKLWESIGS